MKLNGIIYMLIVVIASPFFVMGILFRIIKLGFMAGMEVIEELSDNIQKKVTS